MALLCNSTDLVAGQTPGPRPDDPKLFLWSRETGVILLISHAAGAPGLGSNEEAREMVMNATGRS